jgi:hypothetical protein
MNILTVIGLLTASSGFAKLDPEEVDNGHVYLFEDVNGGTVKDSSKNNNNGTIRGNPKPVKGINGTALKFDGKDDAVHIPDSPHINSGGPWQNRTIKVVFNCANVSKNEKQTIYEEGGRTRGLVIYVFDGELYAGGWNRAEYNWNGAWVSTPIKSNRWYEVALILRDTTGKVEKDKFEMWLDGKLIDRKPGGQLHGHGNDNGIGATIQNTVFHDEDGSGDGYYFEGLIDEVWILNQALTEVDLKPTWFNVDPSGKLTAAWGAIKAQQ